MGYLVYILRCGDGTLYTGCTNDLPSDRGRRKNEQNVKCGKNADNPYTSGRKRAIIYKLNYAFFGGGSPPAERRRP